MQDPIKILIVEDEMSIALELEMIIDELGYQLIGVVDNAEETIVIASEKSPDLILMDIGIKGEYTGLEVAEKINHLPIAILFITSYHSQEMFQRAKATNFTGYLTKPISKFSLQGAIEMAIRFLSNYKKNLSGQASENGISINDASFEKEDIFITRLKNHIINNLNNPDLKLERIALNMGMSRMQLHRKIKTLTNYSAAKYILNIRLEIAFKLLKEKELNISEVAYQVGFNNPNHFSRVFREKYGQTPSYMRKQPEKDK